jgi:hypothetical protein
MVIAIVLLVVLIGLAVGDVALVRALQRRRMRPVDRSDSAAPDSRPPLD